MLLPVLTAYEKEHIAERQPLSGQTCLHRWGSDLATKLQRPVRPEEVVIASQQLEMIFQTPRT